MNPNKAVAELHEIMVDPLSRKLAKAAIDWIENELDKDVGAER